MSHTERSTRRPSDDVTVMGRMSEIGVSLPLAPPFGLQEVSPMVISHGKKGMLATSTMK